MVVTRLPLNDSGGFSPVDGWQTESPDPPGTPNGLGVWKLLTVAQNVADEVTRMEITSLLSK